MATKRKKKRGRPMERRYPPKIDATPEEVAQVLLNAGPVKGPVSGRNYYCVDCKRQVAYPETLYNDNRCAGCHQAAVRLNRRLAAIWLLSYIIP
jgi:nitrate reductase cytochrome c-type subunit